MSQFANLYSIELGTNIFYVQRNGRPLRSAERSAHTLTIEPLREFRPAGQV